MQTEELKAKEETRTIKVDKLATELNHLVASTATTIQNQVEYDEKYNELSTRYFSSFEQLKVIQKEMADKNIRKTKINQFLNALKSQDNLLTEFSYHIFLSLVDRIETYSKDEINVVFKSEK